MTYTVSKVIESALVLMNAFFFHTVLPSMNNACMANHNLRYNSPISFGNFLINGRKKSLSG